MPETRLREQFEDLAQQVHAGRVGWWLFLGSEALLFSALFALFGGLRVAYPLEFRQAAGHTNYGLGIAMTFTLITSSFLLTESVEQAKSGHRRTTTWLLALTLLLGVGFLGLKGAEWGEHFHEGIFPGIYYRLEEAPSRGANIFFSLYYVMTGLHALHVLGGVTAIACLIAMNRRGTFTPSYHPQLELTALYWQFVDIIWLFLWSLFYLLR